MSTNDAEATDYNSESDSNDSDSQNDYYYDDGDESEMNLGNSGQFIEDSESNEENGQDIDEEKLLAELEDGSVIDNNEQAVEHETLIVANENYVGEADGENSNMQASSAENAEMVENVAEHDSGNENAVDTQSSANEQNAQHVFETTTDISEQNTNMENANLSQAVNPAVANALDTPAPNEESSGDVCTPVKPADANVQQGGGSGTPVNLAVPHVSTTKKPLKRKTAQEPEGEKNARLAWKDRGKVIFRHPWEIRSASYIDGLVKGVQRLKGDLYCKWTKTGFERLSQTTFTVSDNKTKDDPDLGFLHLKNVDNDVAAAIREHLEVSYDSAVVQVQKIFLMLFNTCLI